MRIEIRDPRAERVTRSASVIWLLLSVYCIAADERIQDGTDELQLPAIDSNANVEAVEIYELPDQEQIEKPMKPDLDAPVPTEVEPITLDALLKQARQTPHLQREAMLARLAERRRLALALRTTLEAAEQVAAFGEAGTQLLQDASLDTVVETMINKQEHEELELENAARSKEAANQVDARTAPDEHTNRADAEKEPGFDAWRPVYIVRDSRGQKVGWRHLERQERVITYLGEQWHIGDDTVTVVAVASDQSGRYLVIEINGERREVDLF